MRYVSITDRLATLGPETWAVREWLRPRVPRFDETFATLHGDSVP